MYTLRTHERASDWFCVCLCVSIQLTRLHVKLISATGPARQFKQFKLQKRLIPYACRAIFLSSLIYHVQGKVFARQVAKHTKNYYYYYYDCCTGRQHAVGRISKVRRCESRARANRAHKRTTVSKDIRVHVRIDIYIYIYVNGDGHDTRKQVFLSYTILDNFNLVMSDLTTIPYRLTYCCDRLNRCITRERTRYFCD